MQTKLGGQTYKQAMIKKYGNYDNWINALREIGKKGGSSDLGNRNKRGFASDRKDDNGLTGKQRAKKLAVESHYKALIRKKQQVAQDLKAVKKEL